MGVLDFLFEGSPPPSTTTYGSTVENMPKWLSDYTQALIARANMVAGEGYQAYQGPRVAGFTDDQTNAFDVIRNNIGNWNDEFDASKSATGGALTQAMPYFNKASSYFDQASAMTPDKINEYMDPYVGNVIDRAKLEANRQWDEKIMPGIEGRFITSGQSGSSGHQDLLQKAGRDVTEGINSQSLAALSDAYKTAGSQYQADASRLAGLGQTTGALGSSVAGLGLQQGSQMSGLAQLQQQMAGRDASSLSMVGDARQQQIQRNLDLAYQDFQQQRDYPRQNVDWMSSVIRGIPYDRTTNTTQTGPANAYQPSPLSQLISLYGLYKDVTQKARGGAVRKAHGGVIHIPGPIGGYGRYAEGGKVNRLRGALGLLKELSGDLMDEVDDAPKTDREAYRKIRSEHRANPDKQDMIEWLEQWRRDNPGKYAEGGKVRALREIDEGRRIVDNLADDWLPRTRGLSTPAPNKKVRGGLSVLEY
jgi:hypothetical protein